MRPTAATRPRFLAATGGCVVLDGANPIGRPIRFRRSQEIRLLSLRPDKAEICRKLLNPLSSDLLIPELESATRDLSGRPKPYRAAWVEDRGVRFWIELP